MSENRKIAQWITVNGNHIPIFEGESKKQAVERFTARQSQVKSEEQQKQRQIESNKKESKKKNDSDVIKNRKQAQLAIVQKYNPKDKNINSQATWVESEDDIKTWDETMDDEWGYSAGDDVTEDFTWKDALEAQKSGYITVYSSKPIQQGTFVTPSKMIAVSYGNKNPYSKKIPVDKVAWIDRSEGQFADVEAESATKSERKQRDPHDLIPKDSYTHDAKYQTSKKWLSDTANERNSIGSRWLEAYQNLEKARDKHIDPERVKLLGRNQARMLVWDKEFPDTAEAKQIADKLKARKDELEKEAERHMNVLKRAKRDHSEEQRQAYGRPEFKEAHGEYEGFKSNESTTPYVDEKLKEGKAHVVEMTPEQYIHECAHYIFKDSTVEGVLAGRLDTENLKRLTDKMRNGTKMDTPYINYERDGEQPGNQEGLHRAIAAYSLGIEKIPVIIIGKRRK